MCVCGMCMRGMSQELCTFVLHAGAFPMYLRTPCAMPSARRCMHYCLCLRCPGVVMNTLCDIIGRPTLATTLLTVQYWMAERMAICIRCI